MLNILLVDDEPSIRLTVADALRDRGHNVVVAADGGAALELVQSTVFDLVISDIRLPKIDGLTLFRSIQHQSAGTDVILITAYGSVEDAVAALKDGAKDYLTKPFDTEELLLRVERLSERRGLEKELRSARASLSRRGAYSSIIGQSPQMLRLLQRVETVAPSDASVIITGESGTGKELIARTLHNLSPRHERPFVAVNCAAFPETLIEAELFGHEKGAFTGAMRRREGRFKTASGGTLFLDEIAEVPMMVQAKLLRVLQDGIIEPLGSDEPFEVDVRVISATHRNLKERIAQGSFREDLYYRLNVIDIVVPPLRERRGDLPILVEHFLRVYGREGGALPSISPRAWASLSEYEFPGNVRELEHAIQHAVVLSGGAEIDIEHLPRDISKLRDDAPPSPAAGFRTLAAAVKEFERQYLLRAISAAEGKKTAAADLLGISRKNLWEKLKAHEIGDAEADE